MLSAKTALPDRERTFEKRLSFAVRPLIDEPAATTVS